RPRPAAERVPPAAPPSSASPGPWGRLTISPLVISPPLELVSADWGGWPPGPARWHFPGVSREEVEAFLLAAGMARDRVTAVLATARPDADTGGLVATPDPELIRGLTPEIRSRLYSLLAKSTRNYDQSNAFRFFGSAPDPWLHGSLMSPESRRLVEPLIYQDGEFLSFSDVELVRSQVRDPAERQRIAKTLLRQSTMLVTLEVSDPSEIGGLAEYWGRGGRRTDIRPLLESLADAEPGRSIDIVHLLPTFARNHLYRYPKISTADLNKPLLANCLWSSLNFFRAVPDDRFLDVLTALDTLRRDYVVVESDFQLGDIVALLDEEGVVFHVAVYVADGLVFSKNGRSTVAPWILMPLERLKAYYRARAASPRLIYHRPNELS
ncbi:MAG TPA: hypothetical protein VML55_06920, partial [Planctomycetaceae bacterium]|nr:hypothetical protein [Planctomycetaceae bacterium]